MLDVLKKAPVTRLEEDEHSAMCSPPSRATRGSRAGWESPSTAQAPAPSAQTVLKTLENESQHVENI